MLTPWFTHDAGAFSVELPSGWEVQQPAGGVMLVQDLHSHLRLTFTATSRTALPGRAGAALKTTSLESQLELQKWIESQTQANVRQRPRVMNGMPYPTASAEGFERLHGYNPWYKRLLPRWFSYSGVVVWRYWALLNPHMLLLVNCQGKPAVVEKQRETLDRLLRSVHLPDRDILIGRRFSETVVSLARSWFPQTSVTLIDDIHVQFGTQNVSLASLHRRYLASPETLPTQLHAFLSAVQGELPASVVANSWSRARERILPTFLTRTAVHNHASRLVHEPWVNGLAISYVLEDDAPGTGASQESPFPGKSHGSAEVSLKSSDSSQLLRAGERAITMEDLEHWHVTAEELHTQALQNLVLYSHEHTMQGQKGDGFTMLCLGGNLPAPGTHSEAGITASTTSDRHNAARILLPELHRKLREHLGATFFAAIPTRDLLLAFSVSDEAILSRVRDQIASDFTHASNGLSPKLFLVTPDGIAGDPHDEEDFLV